MSVTNALLGIHFDCIANTYLPSQDDPRSKATFADKELHDLAVRSLCEKITRFAKLQTLKSCAADSKAFATESV